MKYSIFLLFCLSVVSCNIRSQYNDYLPDEDGGLLWEISGNGLQYSSYLLGTMHNVRRTYLDSISGFRKVFRSVQQIAVERDMFTEDSINRTSKKSFPAYLYMPRDVTYEMLYDQEDYHFVDSVLRKEIPNYFEYKPLFWASFFMNKMIYKKVENLQNGMDRFILLIGLQNNKKIYFMETLEEVDKASQYIDSLRYTIVDLQQQANSLKSVLQRPDSISASLSIMEKLYKEQKIGALMKIDSLNRQINSSAEFKKLDPVNQQAMNDYFESLFKRLGPDRNEGWMKNILPMVKNGSSLMAVGAAHLIGEEGLIAKLRRLGYTVEPVKQ